MTWTTLPMFFAIRSFSRTAPARAPGAPPWPVGTPLLQCGGAADDLGDLLRDLGLAGPVVRAPEHVQHLAGVVRRVLHGRPPRALLGCSRLDQRAVDAVAHVERQQPREDLVRRG